MSVNKSRKGDISEIKVVSYLLEEGWEVCKNVGCSGPIDLIGVDPDGQVVLMDVKTASFDETGNLIGGRGLTDLQKELGVCIVEYHPLKDTVKFVRHHNGTGYRHRNESGAQQDLALSF